MAEKVLIAELEIDTGNVVKDLKERTNLNITKIEIGRINLLRDSVRLRIHYPHDDTWNDGVEVTSFEDDSSE